MKKENQLNENSLSDMENDDVTEVNKLIKIILKYMPAGKSYDDYYYFWLKDEALSKDPDWDKYYKESVNREKAFYLLSQGKISW